MKGVESFKDLKDRCRIDDITGCWVWAQSVYLGLAKFWYAPARRTMSITNVMRYLMPTQPPQGQHWYAACGNVLCCNPAHRKLGTLSTLMKTVSPTRRSPSTVAKIGKTKRARSPHYTPEKAKAIRESTETSRVLGERYGLSKTMICRIRLGNRWADQGSSAFTWRP
jgi:hypothetical protein